MVNRMEDKILEILKEEEKGHPKSLSVNEIFNALNLKTVDDLKDLYKAINNLEDNLKLYRTNKDKFMLFNNSNLKIGKFIATKKGYGFVDIEGDEDVFVPQVNINNAIQGDTVVVEVTSITASGMEGRIVRIQKRELKSMVGEYVEENGKAYVKLDEEKVHITIVIDKKNNKGAMPGHKVLVRPTKKLQGNVYVGEIEKIIGHKNDPGVDILSITNKYGINDTFSDKVMEEAEKLPDSVSEEEIASRRDLRDHMIFTIDGDDTKDIDDAIELNILENGNYSLGVHIADVSYYVKEHTYIGDEAYERGTSVYLADRVIPMLPHKLSNGICSLNPNADRLTISCVMEINKNGDIVSSDIFESVIRSRKQMTYKCVNKILEENIIPDGYEEFADKLKEMEVLAQILRKNKVKRGYIDFDIDESKIIVNDKGEAIDVVLRERGVGEKLIEDFMIAANEAVATTIYYMDLPFVYRVHGTPNEEKIKKFLTFVSSLGITINGKIKEITPIQMQKLLEQLKDEKEYRMLSSLLLRSMQKAIYDTNNIGHFGLGSKCYTHFTSPIRRFPDTTVHRLLRKYLFECKMDRDTISYLEKTLPLIALHSSEKERDAVSCEREVDDMKKAEYMEKHIGEAFTGMISGVTNFGIFVELPNLIEGLIKIEDIKGDKYFFDEATMSIKSKSNPRGYRLGDILDVVVVSANKEERKIDFEIKEKKKIKK